MSNRIEKFIINKKKPLKLIAKICMVFFVALFGLAMIGGTIMFENEDAVNTVFKAVTQIKQEDPDAANKDLEYYKSAFRSVKEVQNNGRAYAETIVAEGATLLKNEKPNNLDTKALPLVKGAKISLFSTSSTDPIISGTGSSGTAGADVSLMDGIKAAGIEVNEDLYTWYEMNQSKYGRQQSGGFIGRKFSIGDAYWNEIDTEAKTDKEYGDAAVFVLSRIGGEGRDATMYGDPTDDATDGNYLKLSPSERDMLKNLKKEKDNGTFKRIIVLINSANFVEGEFINDPELGIDAAIWVGAYGSMGAYAIGDILVGNVNPSGRLSDTMWKYHYKNPVHANFGMLTADEKDPEKVTQWTITTNASANKNIVYQEGIYSGYRYTETRYEDKVLGTENAGDFDYADTVSYPFGYGLSYADFEYSNFNVTRNIGSAVEGTENTYTVSVDVTNMSKDVSGKEVVQIYLQKPYTDYDKENHIEKAAVELVGFGKTALLEPGKTETVKVTVDERYFASYDSHKAKTYIVDAGPYYLTAARDAHDAVNNILAKKGKTTSDGMTADGNASFVFEQRMQFDDEIYSNSAVTGAKITNQFDNVDLKLYDGAGENRDKFEYVTRSDWQGTVTYGLGAKNEWLDSRVKVTATSKMQEDFTKNWDPVVEKDDVEYPTYGSKKTSWNLIDLRAFADDDEDPTNDKWIPYKHEMWDELLDQLTFEDTVQLLKCGFRKTNPLASIGKPETIDHNGASGPVEAYNVMSNADISKSVNQGLAVRKNDPDKGEKPVAYPCNGLVASTFNLVLADYYGRHIGENMLWAGYSGLYGFGINTHRSPYGGRNFEYYSEDPFLAGMICAEQTRGVATRGGYVYLKHCFLNDQESYRCGGFTWANEQTCREIYLRAFQIAIEKGGAQCVMGGLNSLGVTWTGTQGFMNTVLRGEFGMTGHAVTDSYGAYNGSYVRGVYYGNDIPDGTMNASKENFDYVKDGGYGKMAWAMREAAHRVLYTVVHSNAMNNYSSGTRIIIITPWWKTMMIAFRAVFGVLMGLGIAAWGTVYFFEIKNRKAGER